MIELFFVAIICVILFCGVVDMFQKAFAGPTKAQKELAAAQRAAMRSEAVRLYRLVRGGLSNLYRRVAK